MAPSQESLDELVKEFAKPSTSFGSDRATTIQDMSIWMNDCLKDGIAKMVKAASGQPMLLAYSSDGTPLRTHLKIPANCGRMTFKREGKYTKEFLAQVVFARTISADGESESRCAFAPPLPLVNGKSSLAIFTAGRQFGTSLRHIGHAGIAVQFYAFDRAGYSSLSRLFKQQHIKDVEARISEGPGAVELRETEWVESAGCALHDCHNALKWSLGCQTPKESAQLLKDVWGIFASLRNSYDLVLAHLAGWLANHIMFKAPDDCPCPERMQSVWEMLGVDPKFSDILAHDLRLHWDFAKGQICVSSWWQGRRDTLSEVSGAIC